MADENTGQMLAWIKLRQNTSMMELSRRTWFAPVAQRSSSPISLLICFTESHSPASKRSDGNSGYVLPGRIERNFI
jgi:hypothetical protein